VLQFGMGMEGRGTATARLNALIIGTQGKTPHGGDDGACPSTTTGGWDFHLLSRRLRASFHRLSVWWVGFSSPRRAVKGSTALVPSPAVWPPGRRGQTSLAAAPTSFPSTSFPSTGVGQAVHEPSRHMDISDSFLILGFEANEGRAGLNPTNPTRRQAKQPSVATNQFSVAGYGRPFVSISPAITNVTWPTGSVRACNARISGAFGDHFSDNKKRVGGAI
jgi:hypothetical protein